MPALRILVLVTLLIAAGVTGVESQALRGRLINETTGGGIGGAYVVLVDSDSLEVTRALTDGLGRFTLHAPRSGSYRVRTRRIGYRSTLSSVIALVEEETRTLELMVRPIPVRLAALTVAGGGECRIVGEQALEVQTVWEEARKVLEAVAWSDIQQHLIYELERFERWYTFSFQLVREERRATPTRRVTPFRSASVDELDELGYVRVEEDSIAYEAPDAEVFFSRPFLQHHCFRLDDKREGGRRMVGLRFEPVAGREMPDVKGVFWLDAETAELERLELRYVNVGAWQRERGAGGELTFERLPDGRWIVGRWWIRMPLVRKVETLKGPVWNLEEAIAGFEEEGGVVLKVYAPDGRTLFARERAVLRGVVFDSTTGLVISGARVRLAGTDHVTVSRADGSYTLTDLPEGRHRVTFTHPRAALLGLADAKDVDLEVGVRTRADLAIPAPPSLVERICPRPLVAEVTGLVVGTVRDSARDSVVPGATVRVVWAQPGPTGEPPGVRWVETRADAQGVYRVCVPSDAPLSVELVANGIEVAAVPAVFAGNRLLELDLDMPAGFGRP